MKRHFAAAALIALGLAAWGLAQIAAFALAGAGHGWIAPLYLTIPLVLLYPAALSRAGLAGRRRSPIDPVLLTLAFVLDGLLIGNILLVENAYFAKSAAAAPGSVLLWLALFAGWQAAALSAFLRVRRPEN